MKTAATFQIIAVLLPPALWANGYSLPIPASGAYLGIWADPALGSGPEAAIEVREGPAPNGIHHGFALHLHYYAWKNIAPMLNNGVFQPDAALQGDIAHGRVPVIAWVCDASVPNSDHVIASSDASEDAIITATARALAQHPGPVMLRWFWEFNVLGNNQACRGDTGGRPAQQVYDDFIAAWRHIWQLFQTAGANNVVFLWNPGHYTADGNADDPHGFYPGNTYVDWIGLDTYQDDASASFSTNINPFYSDFSQPQYAGKPLMVGENGSKTGRSTTRSFRHPISTASSQISRCFHGSKPTATSIRSVRTEAGCWTTTTAKEMADLRPSRPWQRVRSSHRPQSLWWRMRKAEVQPLRPTPGSRSKA